VEKPYAVVFAGVPGTSKSAIAYNLSWNFNLPILSNDSVRFEVKEDLRVESLSIKEDLVFSSVNQNGALDEYEKRIKQRRDTILAIGRSVIFDGSVDRRWTEVKEELQNYNYDWFMINMELSRSFLTGLYLGTGRESFMAQLDDYMEDHQRFLNNHSHDISLEITDGDFKDRLQISVDGLSHFLDDTREIRRVA
jgi:hypothetical protein